MKNMFDYPQEYFIAYDMDLLDAYLFSFLCHHCSFFQSEYAQFVPARKRDELLVHLSFLKFKRRGLDQRLQSLNRKMMILCREHNIQTSDLSPNNIDVFGYPTSIMDRHNLDLKDILILHWMSESAYSQTLYHKRINTNVYTYLNHRLFTLDYPIISISKSGLRNRIHTLIEKGLVQRHTEYCEQEKMKRCYYSIVDENLMQNTVYQAGYKIVKTA